ncbi:MAG: hypothetical protein JOY54_18385 [Acidobacteriaceae bacterium]|nr:hypothetical protein [Acidobacteriaceae bacterium]
MSSRELRKQRRAQERKQKRLERTKAVQVEAMPHLSTLTDPDLDDAFPPEFIAEANAMRARIHARASLATSQPAPGHSTGPRTPEGKAVSSRNAFKHGLASGEIIAPGENPEEFESLLESLRDEHTPATLTEDLLIRQMAQSWWLAQRALRLQNTCFHSEEVDARKLALFLRYQTTHERAFHKALAALIRLQKERRRNQAHFVSSEAANGHHAPQFVSHTTATPLPEPAAKAGKGRFRSENLAEWDEDDRFARPEAA